MKMTLEERKKWLEDHKEEISVHARLRAKKIIETIIPSLRETIGITEESEYQKMFESEMNRYNDEMCDCEETINGIDLHPYLAKIRYLQDHEEIMFLLIKDNIVVKEIIAKGDTDTCDKNYSDTENAMKEAVNLSADIYIVHNHPLEVAAIPSGGVRTRLDINDEELNKYTYVETGDYHVAHTVYPELCKKYNVEMLDYAVVTECDYYSLEQKGYIPYIDERKSK